MSRTDGSRVVNGRLRRRLLVNALVEPAEAAARLPAGLRPHRTPLGTVVGCCLLDIEDLRPAPLPASFGIRQRAAAHRISAEWEDETGATVVGVWVPGRRTDSRLAVALGGRWFPGVHEPAEISLQADGHILRWSVHDRADFHVDAAISLDAVEVADDDDTIGATCLGATVGLSARRTPVLEGAAMRPDHWSARRVAVEQLDSTFIASFETAIPAPAYLMENVAVTWSATAFADAPRVAA